MSNDQAKFTINATPSEDPVTGDRLYQATAGEVLTLTLEVSPSSVLRATYSVYDPTVPDSPLASMSAPLLTFVGSGTSSDSPASPNGPVTIAVPGAAAHSYNIRCIVSTVAGQQEFVRQVAVPYTLGIYDIAKTTPEETTEYFARTWSDKINQLMDYVGAFTLVGLDDAYDKGGAGLGYFITADIHPVTITAPDTSNNAGMLITQSDVANNPNALEISNAGTGNAIDLQGAGNRGIVSDSDMNLTMGANDAGNHWLKIVASNIGAGAAHIDMDADVDIDIDSRSGHISLDSTDDSNFSVTGVAKSLTLAVIGAGVQSVILNSEGTGASAVDINATAGGIELDAATVLELNSSGGIISIGNDAVAQNINIGTGGAARLITVGNDTGVTTLRIKSGTGGITLSDPVSNVFLGGAGALSTTGITSIALGATLTSNFTVTGAAQSLALAVVGGGAQKLTLDSAGTGVDSIDITSSVGGIELNAATGVAVLGGILQLTAGGTISTTGDADLILLPNGTGITKIGDAGAAAHAAINDDLFVSGILEVGGATHLLGALGVTGVTTVKNVNMSFASQLYYQTPGVYGSYFPCNANQTIYAPTFAAGTTCNYFLLCEYADRVFDFGHPQQPNPTDFGHSNRRSQVEYWSKTHDTANVVNSTAFGGHTFTTQDQKARGTIDFPGGVPIADETFVINLTTLTWKADGTGNVDHVTIGANAAGCVTNLVASIAECTESGNLTAWAGVADKVVVEWGTGGVAGNAIPFTEACTNMTMDAVTLGTTHAGVAAATLFTIGEDKAVAVPGTLSVTGISSLNTVNLSSIAFHPTGSYVYYGGLSPKVDDGTHLYVGATDNFGNRHLIITDSSNIAVDHNHDTLSANPTVFGHSVISPAVDDTQWWSLTHDQTNAVKGIGSGSMVTEHKAPTELANDGGLNLPTSSAGWIRFMVGDNEEYGIAHWNAAGTVVLGDVSANVVNTDTGAKFCIISGANPVVVKNRLGAAKTVAFSLHYFTP